MKSSARVSIYDLKRKAKRFQRELKVKAAKRQRVARQQRRFGKVPIAISSIVRRISSQEPRHKYRKYETFKLPRTFSFLEDPEKALSTIHEITSALTNRRCRSIELNYQHCRRYSLGSEALLGVLGRVIKHQKRTNGRTVTINGVYPSEPNHTEIVRDVGIVKEIDADKEHRDLADTKQQFIFMKEKTSTAKGSAYARDDKNQTSENFVKYINDCLAESISKKLTEKACRTLKSCVSELLDNAERHAMDKQQGKWYVRAHVNFSHEHPSCEIVIFNFGKTIAATYDGLSAEHFSYSQQVKPYVDRHLGVRGLTREALITVASLQGRVSCKNNDERRTCGTGTVELLNFFQELHDDICSSGLTKNNELRPLMALMSGNTWIKFDGTYRLSFTNDVADDRSLEEAVYPLNDTPGKLADPPDTEFVKSLDTGFFPGVMINIRFPLEVTRDQT